MLITDKTLSFLAKNAALMYITTRPSHQECERVQELKLPWARLYREEFCIKDFILTPNIVSVIFKNKDSFEDYLKKAPIINNSYPEIRDNCYSEIKNANKRYPKWLINLLCCFTIKRKNRKHLREKYIRK